MKGREERGIWGRAKGGKLKGISDRGTLGK